MSDGIPLDAINISFPLAVAASVPFFKPPSPSATIQKSYRRKSSLSKPRFGKSRKKGSLHGRRRKEREGLKKAERRRRRWGCVIAVEFPVAQIAGASLSLSLSLSLPPTLAKN